MGGGEQLIQQRSLFTAPLMLHNLQHPLKQKFSLTEKWAAWLKTGSEIGSYQGTAQFVFVLGVFERHSEKIYIDWKKNKKTNNQKGKKGEMQRWKWKYRHSGRKNEKEHTDGRDWSLPFLFLFPPVLSFLLCLSKSALSFTWPWWQSGRLLGTCQLFLARRREGIKLGAFMMRRLADVWWTAPQQHRSPKDTVWDVYVYVSVHSLILKYQIRTSVYRYMTCWLWEKTQ